MLVLKVNDTKVKCPVCWEEVTVRQYQRIVSELQTGDTAIKIFSILTGTDYNKIWEAEAEDLEAAIYQATAFVFNTPPTFKDKERPKSLRIGGVLLTIPEKIHKLTVGQNFQMRQEIHKALRESRPVESLLSIALAIYMQPIAHAPAKFDMDQARELEAQILDMNIFDVYPAAFFLLSQLLNSGTSGIRSWLGLLIPLWPTWLQRRVSIALSLLVMSCSLIGTPRLTASSPAWWSKNPSTSLFPSSTPGRSATSTMSDSLK
jgi:hypothetical protein